MSQRIVKADVFVTSPSRNFVTLRMTTEDGVTGIGDATVNGRELAVASYLRDHVCQLLLDQDASAIEDVWQFLYRSGYWRRGPITMAAIAAVDMALWDIKGKVAGMPIYQLLGGASRTGCRAYGHASGTDLESLFDSIRYELELGYRSIRIQTSVPGIEKLYGVAAQAQSSGGAVRLRAGQPRGEARGGGLGLLRLPAPRAHRLRGRPQRVRSRTAPAARRPPPHDPARGRPAGQVPGALRPVLAGDCTPAENQEALRYVRSQTTTPLAIGEVFNSVYDIKDLIQDQLIDYVRCASTHFGGISSLKKVMNFAEMYQVKSGFHGPTVVSPVGFAAQLHVGLSIHNFGLQEYITHSEKTLQVFHPSLTFQDGYLHPGDAPGLGVEFDEEAAAKFPYDQAYLPFNRLKDGTVHNW